MASTMRVRQRGKERHISAADLQAAVHKFVDAGGIIKKLPEEKTAPSQMVGKRWNTSEIGSEPH